MSSKSKPFRRAARRAALATVVIALAALVGLACESDGGSPTGGVLTSACESCLQASCPAWQTCQSTPGCLDGVRHHCECVCPNPDTGGPAYQACMDRHDGPAAADEVLESLSLCSAGAAAPCASACAPNNACVCSGQPGGPTSDAGGTDPSDDCSACLTVQCPAAVSACESAPACVAVQTCVTACGGDEMDTCVAACLQANPGGAGLFQPVLTCAMTLCAAPCVGEPDPPLEVKNISFNGTLYVYPIDSIDGANTVWGLPAITVGAGSATDGASNTAAAVSGYGVIGIDFAAKVCADLDSHGSSDWYLPAKDELQALFENRATLGHFEPLYYWSSTESSADQASVQNFADGVQSDIGKGLLARIRCVRR